MNRSQFLIAGSLATMGLVTTSRASKAMTETTQEKKKFDKGPPLTDEQVREFVGAAHADLPRVEAMLKEQPKLVNAVWDWGGGDFESALGGAAHMGRRDIALVLLASGARIDVFAAAMLGELEIVKSALTAFPDALKTPGPHGIPLIAHAKMGGEKAEPVLKYLESL